MGEDKYILKGAGLGALEWGALYGVLSNLGATAIYPVKPKDAIATFASHLAFGATKMIITTKLGDERLFKPKNLTMEINDPQPLFPKLTADNRHPRQFKVISNQRLGLHHSSLK